jgi:hypothetical protein
MDNLNYPSDRDDETDDSDLDKITVLNVEIHHEE